MRIETKMRRQRIVENDGALELLKDMEAGETDVTPEDISPDLDQNILADGIPYSQKKDPEVNGTLAESRNKRARRIQEGKNDEILSFLQTAEDGSYESFKNSEFFERATNRDGTTVSKSDYVRAVNYLVSGGKIDRNELPPNTTTSNRDSGSANAYEDKHSSDIYTREPDAYGDEPSSTLKGWNKYADESASITAEETFEDMAAIVKEIVTGVADKRHALIAGDPGIGKTYLVREVVKKYIGESGKKLTYSAGAMSPSLTSVVPFFFYHKDNEILILDDNDKILMRTCDQNTQNFMKAVLDPSALNKPVSVPTTMMAKFQAQLDMISGLDESTSKGEGIRISIDTEALKEQRFVVSVNGEVVSNDYITEAEARDLSNMIVSRKLTEKKDEFDDLFNEDDGDGEQLDGDPMASEFQMEPSFIFNSSVIFISNLKLADISPAVADRCENCEVTLTLPQFMTRLEGILGGLCQGAEYSSRPQYIRDWAKASMFVTLQGIVEAFNRGVKLFGSEVAIRRKFTFRMFEEFCGFFARRGTEVAARMGINLEDKSQRDKVVREIEPFIIKKILIWLKQEQRRESTVSNGENRIREKAEYRTSMHEEFKEKVRSAGYEIEDIDVEVGEGSYTVYVYKISAANRRAVVFYARYGIEQGYLRTYRFYDNYPDAYRGENEIIPRVRGNASLSDELDAVAGVASKYDASAKVSDFRDEIETDARNIADKFQFNGGNEDVTEFVTEDAKMMLECENGCVSPKDVSPKVWNQYVNAVIRMAIRLCKSSFDPAEGRYGLKERGMRVDNLYRNRRVRETHVDSFYKTEAFDNLDEIIDVIKQYPVTVKKVEPRYKDSDLGLHVINEKGETLAIDITFYDEDERKIWMDASFPNNSGFTGDKVDNLKENLGLLVSGDWAKPRTYGGLTGEQLFARVNHLDAGDDLPEKYRDAVEEAGESVGSQFFDMYGPHEDPDGHEKEIFEMAKSYCNGGNAGVTSKDMGAKNWKKFIQAVAYYAEGECARNYDPDEDWFDDED